MPCLGAAPQPQAQQEGLLAGAGEPEALRSSVALVIALGRLRHFREAILGLQVLLRLADAARLTWGNPHAGSLPFMGWQSQSGSRAALLSVCFWGTPAHWQG